ncbi:hypothetical protein BGZ60DRAFT_431719 [Tricladium varicosporioides]|nr:hypothetical protein BGZ60DRAFT_431719 [Hymenoscyphus varicosporioides]
MVRRRRQAHGNESLSGTLVTVGIAVCCMPCICAIGGVVLLSHTYKKISNYHRPSTLRKIEQRRRDRNFERRTPRNLVPRYGRKEIDESGLGLTSPLTIGRPIEVIYPDVNDLKPVVEIEFKNEIEGKDKSRYRLSQFLEKTKNQIAKEEVTPMPTPKELPTPKVTHLQQDSSFMTKLPYEIRQQIYRETIGGYVFHIYFVDAYRRMAHLRCKHQDPDRCEKRDCRNRLKQQGAKDKWGQCDLMALLQSCRIIYSEAIDLLYKCNTFEFMDIENVLRLSMTILPERMKLITNIRWKYGLISNHSIAPDEIYLSLLMHIANYHHRICPVHNFQDTTPWLKCVATEDDGEGCSCVGCLPLQTYKDITVSIAFSYSCVRNLDI